MKINMIYLAAGNSRRFGSNKLCYEIEGKPMYLHGLETLEAVLEEEISDGSIAEEDILDGNIAEEEISDGSIAEEEISDGSIAEEDILDGNISKKTMTEEIVETSLVIVTAFPEIREEAERLKQRLADRVNVTDSPDREKGISYSIKAGLRASGEADYYLFCVADQPWIRKETIQTLIQTTIRQQSVGGYVEWNGVSGNPAIFSRTLVPELLALEGDTGGKRILKGRDDICTIQAQEAAEMRDIDEKMQQ